MKMLVVAGLVFAADVVAVALIAVSLWIESWFGLQHRVMLDFIFVAAICYGLAGWIVGKLIMLEIPTKRAAEETQSAIKRPIRLRP